MADHLAPFQRNERGDDKTLAVETRDQIGLVIATKCRSVESNYGGTMLGAFFDDRDHGRI